MFSTSVLLFYAVLAFKIEKKFEALSQKSSQLAAYSVFCTASLMACPREADIQLLEQSFQPM